ncbi:MAG: class I SAM-dependent methyltransferase [Pseudomonadota bacterium]
MSSLHAVYGHVPPGLADIPAGSLQTSPRIPSSIPLSTVDPANLDGIVLYAPENTLERKYVLAQAVLAVKPDGALTVLAPNTKGGTRLAKELSAFGCNVDMSSQRHHRIVRCRRPAALNMPGISDALEMGSPRLDPALDLWTQPGLFSWNRADPGSSLLMHHLPPLEGSGADLGCGYGLLARAVLTEGTCRKLILIDIDRRALDMARCNVASANFAGKEIEFLWTDVRVPSRLPHNLDFVVMNPPFHDGGVEDRTLGRIFIERAAEMLRQGGVLWLTANRHLPYEEPLELAFANMEQIAQKQGYKIYKAHR